MLALCLILSLLLREAVPTLICSDVMGWLGPALEESRKWSRNKSKLISFHPKNAY